MLVGKIGFSKEEKKGGWNIRMREGKERRGGGLRFFPILWDLSGCDDTCWLVGWVRYMCMWIGLDLI